MKAIVTPVLWVLAMLVVVAIGLLQGHSVSWIDLVILISYVLGVLIYFLITKKGK